MIINEFNSHWGEEEIVIACFNFLKSILLFNIKIDSPLDMKIFIAIIVGYDI